MLDKTGTMQLTNLSHVGIAVKSAEKTVRWLSSVWNIGTPEVFEYWPKAEDMIVGEAFGARLVWIKFELLTLELL
jgi:hypothetical protein